MKTKRNSKQADLIRTIIARLLQKEVSDPRLKFITITGVDVSPDSKNAIVFFSLLDPTKENIQSALTALEKASGYFRTHVSKSAELRHTPKIFFKFDESLGIGERISELLKKTEE